MNESKTIVRWEWKTAPNLPRVGPEGALVLVAPDMLDPSVSSGFALA